MCWVRERGEQSGTNGAMDEDDVAAWSMGIKSDTIQNTYTLVYHKKFTIGLRILHSFGYMMLLHVCAPCSVLRVFINILKCEWSGKKVQKSDEIKRKFPWKDEKYYSHTRTEKKHTKSSDKGKKWVYSYRLPAHFSIENFIKNEIVLIVYPSLFLLYTWGCSHSHVCVW